MSDPPLRILHLNFHRGWGGQPARILMGSRELARRGHQVALAVPGDGMLAARACEAGLTVFGGFRFAKPRRVVSFARDVVLLGRVAREFRPDVLHSHGSQDTWTAAVAKRLGYAKAPLLLTRHNSKVVSCHAGNRWLYGRALDGMVVVSYGVLERYEEFFRRGVLDRARIPVVPSSIEFARYDGPLDRERLRRELSVPPGAPLVGCVGRLVRDKGQEFLLRAFSQVRARRPDARLALAGTGTDEPRLRRVAAELALTQSVAFLGFRKDVPDLTASFDLAVLPSIDCDASPAVVKEAMYLRKPVVVTDIGGLREMVEDGRTGRIVPPADPGALAAAILDLLDDPARAAALGEAAREIVRTRYSIAALGDRYESVYADLVAHGRLTHA